MTQRCPRCRGSIVRNGDGSRSCLACGRGLYEREPRIAEPDEAAARADQALRAAARRQGLKKGV